MQRICHSLAINGFKVLLVGRLKTNSVPLLPQLYQQQRIKCWFEKGKLFYLEYNIRLFFLLLPKTVDIISSVDLDTILPVVLVSKLRSKISVFDAHEYFTEVPEVVNRPLTKRVWRSLGHSLIPRVDLAYTVSQSLQSLFSQLYKRPFHLIRNISVSSPPKSPPTNTQAILLYQGALNAGRGIEELIVAIKELANVKLWIAGEGDLSKQLRQLCRELHLTDKVHFWGYLQPNELKELTSKATIGINILENKGLSYYYSLANKTFDYIHAGIPAIHSNFPEYQLLNEQYEIGVLVDDLQASTLKKAILQLIDNPTFYNKLQQNCAIAAKDLNWEKEEQRLIELYKGLRTK